MAKADRVLSTPPINTPAFSSRWFQSNLSSGDPREIYEGDDFANRLVARAETPEIAAMIVAEHNAADRPEPSAAFARLPANAVAH
jgi:hypothetical protein